MSDTEMPWVIKNGILAGRPPHSDEELGDIVAFVKALPNIRAMDCRALDHRLPSGREEGMPTRLRIACSIEITHEV